MMSVLPLRLQLLRVSPILLPIWLSACGSASNPLPVVTVVDNSCKAFRQLTWSVDDTPKTSSAVRRHNRKYAELCSKTKLAKK